MRKKTIHRVRDIRSGPFDESPSKTYDSGSLSALSAWPGTSMWMKQLRSLISVMHGLFTNSWNDVSDAKHKSFPIKNESAKSITPQMCGELEGW